MKFYNNPDINKEDFVEFVCNNLCNYFQICFNINKNNLTFTRQNSYTVFIPYLIIYYSHTNVESYNNDIDGIQRFYEKLVELNKFDVCHNELIKLAIRDL